MSDFISIPPAPASPPGAVVSGGDFWPEVDLNNFRDVMRIGGSTIPDPRLIAAIEGALLTLDQDLAGWRVVQAAAGHNTLEDVPSETIGTQSRLIMLYRRAIYAYAAADLIETHPDVTITPKGADREAAQSMTPDDHRRNGVQAIRDIKGRRRITAKLI